VIEESIAFNAMVGALVTTGYVISFRMQEGHPCCVLTRPDQNPMLVMPEYHPVDRSVKRCNGP